MISIDVGEHIQALLNIHHILTLLGANFLQLNLNNLIMFHYNL